MPLTNPQLAQAIKQHSPGRGFPFPFDGYEGLLMDDGQPKPPLAELESAWLDVVAAEADLAAKRSGINNEVETLRTWAEAHEDTIFNGWDASTTADKLANTKTLHRRFGVFLRRFTDFYQGHQFKP